MTAITMTKATATTATQKPVISMATANINDIVPLLFAHPVISEYIDRFNPVGDKVIKNECYSIVYDDLDYPQRISVYLNNADYTNTICC